MTAPDDVPGLDSAAFATLARELQADEDRSATGEAIVNQLLGVVPEAGMVSLTVAAGRHRHLTLAATDPVAAEADELQYELGEGPCLDAIADTDLHWLRSGDVRADRRWPTWGPRGADLGVRSVLSIQMVDHERPIGALNIYSGESGAFADRDTVDVALTVSIHAANALAAATTMTNLRTAISSRHAIGMAQGILMARYDLDEQQSFELLRRVSSENQTKIRDLALHVVGSRGEI